MGETRVDDLPVSDLPVLNGTCVRGPDLMPRLGPWAPTTAGRQALPTSPWVLGIISAQKARLLGLSLQPSQTPRLLLGPLRQAEEFSGVVVLP